MHENECNVVLRKLRGGGKAVYIKVLKEKRHNSNCDSNPIK